MYVLSSGASLTPVSSACVRQAWRVGIMILFLLAGLGASQAEELPLVEKQVFSTTDFETLQGEIIPEVEVGWEAYGELNEARDNVILVTHFFSGNSHAAGRYSEDDPEPGYWDAIIGPGKAIDTNEYYVISVDTLVNQEPFNPRVTTTGPASTNPETGEPYGLDFPVVTIRDFVNIQKEVLESLGIESLHAVVGASMGSLQALDWAAAYPDWVKRMISVIGMGAADPWTIANLQQWAEPILADPAWQGGQYYADGQPERGLHQAITQITLEALHPEIFNLMYADASPREQAPAQDIQTDFSVVDELRQGVELRARYADANHILYLVRANQLFMAGYQDDLASGLAPVTAKSLFIPAANDLLLMPYLAQQAHDTLVEQGKESTYMELEGPYGHLDGVLAIDTKAAEIAEFLATE